MTSSKTHTTSHTPLSAVSDALMQVTSHARPISKAISLTLAECKGMIIAEDVTSPIALPVGDNSAVDGYGVRLDALAANTDAQGVTTLTVAGRIAAGDGPLSVPEESTCLRALTGSMLPNWVDAIVMQEDVTLSDEGRTASFTISPKPGAHIRRRGEDVAQGSVILRQGQRVDARHIALAAAAGVATLPVVRPIRVALLATGSELNAPGAPLPPGGIYDSNTPMLMALLDRPDVIVSQHRTLKDDPDTIRDSIDALSKDHDLLVTSGGMSVSDEDHIRPAIKALGGHFVVHKVKMKPGKPLGVGQIGSCLFIGLPGNPFAAMVGWQLFGNQALSCLAGAKAPTAPLTGEAAFSTSKGRSRQEFIPVRIAGKTASGLPTLERLGVGSSAHLQPLLEADGLASLSISEHGIEQGEKLTFYRFRADLPL